MEETHTNSYKNLIIIIILTIIILLVGSLTYVLATKQTIKQNKTPSLTTGITTPTTYAFSINSVDLSVNPNTISTPCNTQATFTYTVTFHIVPHSQGGTIQFMWSVNNGRSSTQASVTVRSNETTKTYTFTSSGELTTDHTFPGIAEVITTAPNSTHSNQIQPTGQCY